MRARVASFAVVSVVVVACGGATESNLLTGADGGAANDGSAGGDGGPRPTLASLRTCSGPGTCELGAAGCCGITCQPTTELIGIRRGEAASVVAATCEQTQPVPCPACAAQIDPDVQAFCRGGTCTVVDLRTDDLSACSKEDDCVLRYPSCCQPCDGGSPSDLVSVRRGREDDLAAELCTGAERCDRCLPVFPPNARAVCNQATRHCEVR